jgi:YHS domain-containing protein
MPKEEDDEQTEEEETSEETEEEMELGEKEEEVYSEEGREKLVEGDEIEEWEEGFMEGAEGRGKKNCCAYCGKLLEEEEVYEREFDGEMKWFCSEAHAEKYAEKLEKQGKKSKGQEEKFRKKGKF